MEEKHTSMARNKDLEDLMAALKGENEGLKESLRMTGGSYVPTKDKSAAKGHEGVCK